MMKSLIIIMLVVFIALQFRLWRGDDGVMEVIRLKKEVQVQEVHVAKLTERNNLLEAEVQDLKNRLAALEERARTDLGMIKESETFYQDAN